MLASFLVGETFAEAGMKYCGECGAEYLDTVTECADCGSKEMVSADELKVRGIPNPSERDTRKFVRAGNAEDPLSAEQFVRVLEEERIPVFSRPRRGGSVDALTTAISVPWWEILVPEEFLARAGDLITQEKARIEASSEEAGRAAEEESQAGPETAG